MGPFEYMILFISFIYTIGLTHLLFAMTRMLRHRRSLIFSWPHFLWMLVALANLMGNWIGGYDLHNVEKLPLPTIAIGLGFSILMYFQCALVSPDFEEGESYDMRAFHERESVTYIGVIPILVIAAMAVNYLESLAYSIENAARQNLLVGAMLPPAVVALLVRRPWVQISMPLIILVLLAVNFAVFYPVLEKVSGR
ncbi:hypothetical protein [Novosphingobium sp.]|uniref:hypothetical protein n=1 Tax=Novosphingobium sp. TaxID=1874826 RepID=UPI003BABB5FE